MANETNEAVNQENINQEEEKEIKTPGGATVETEKHPVRDFWKKNKKKIATGAAIVGAVSVGVIADRFGGKLPFFNKKPDDQAATSDDQQ